MSKTLLGSICGIVYGIVDVLLMIPIPFPDEKNKALAMTGAFVSCTVIGFVIGVARMSLPGWLAGLALAVLVNLPVAIITGSYIPILPISAIGGSIIGFVVGRWSR
jgi:hydrogenase/urease accessory protein HupE